MATTAVIRFPSRRPSRLDVYTRDTGGYVTSRKPVPAKAPGPRPDPHDPAAFDAAFAGLTSREWDVLELLSEGLDDNAIAARLGIGHQTVRSHATSLFG